ncbi:hypothetical protein ACSL103130_08740 [Actinomyces slackii]|uniref:Uncharacterized protein n=1 Tax=Actinomyces slackii TaxID=52774 RepID=A0A448KBN1_9ACTO|nr:hypothetical protein [Actinomyces slackii]VEG74335.1 Uncharacterised protein [Actinomyces slackii]
MVLRATDNSWVAYGENGNNALRTLERRTGTKGEPVPGTNAVVFAYSTDWTSSPQAHAYWVEGRAGFSVRTLTVDDVDASTVAAAEKIVRKYAPEVLKDAPERTEDPGPNYNDPATSTATPSPAASSG